MTLQIQNLRGNADINAILLQLNIHIVNIVDDNVRINICFVDRKPMLGVFIWRKA